jgi:lipoate-protein ligase A
MSGRCWRLIIDPPADAAWNMAVDDVLLDAAVADPDCTPTLRLYGWSVPTLSFGRGQPWSRSLCARAKRHGVPGVVRRPTGGAAVIHGSERTYSVIAALRKPPFEGGVVRVYQRIEVALRFSLRILGIEEIDEPRHAATSGDPRRPNSIPEYSCFQELSACETSVNGRKLIGSAQLRRRTAFLQHGALPLEGSDTTARVFDIESPRFTDLSVRLGRTVTADEMDSAWMAGFRNEFGAEFEHRPLDTGEMERVAQRESRYLNLR